MKSLLNLCVLLSFFGCSDTPKETTPVNENSNTEKIPPPDKHKLQPQPKAIPKKSTFKSVDKTIKSGEKTTTVLGGVEDITLIFAGDYQAFGSPNKYLLAFTPDGKMKWKYKTSGNMEMEITHWNGILQIKEPNNANNSQSFTYLDLSEGKLIKLTESFKQPGTKFSYEGKACTFSKNIINCKFNDNSWSVKASAMKKPRYFKNHFCFTTDDRTIYCHEKANGKKVYEQKIPKILNAKNPEKMFFGYIVNKGVIFIGRYEGSIIMKTLP